MNCLHCQKEIENDSKFCKYCGSKQEINEEIKQTVEEDTDTVVTKENEEVGVTEKEEIINLNKEKEKVNESTREEEYVGFWVRFLAAIIDGMILFLPIYLPIVTVGIMNIMLHPERLDLSIFTYLFIFVMLYPVQVSYYALLEGSRWQATIGKKICGIIVVDKNGNKMNMKTSYFRNLMKVVFLMHFAIFLITAAFTKKKQNLHDIFASTYVIYK